MMLPDIRWSLKRWHYLADDAQAHAWAAMALMPVPPRDQAAWCFRVALRWIWRTRRQERAQWRAARAWAAGQRPYDIPATDTIASVAREVAEQVLADPLAGVALAGNKCQRCRARARLRRRYGSLTP